jgi:CDP-diacylglycerol--serine O-phosphatidyltransferase
MRPALREPPVRPPGSTRRPRLVAFQVLPTLVTLGNVLTGFLAIAYAADAAAQPAGSVAREALWAKASWMILLGMVCDALDGRVARLTGAASSFGAELDSLADMITFGVAPAFLAKGIAQAAFPSLPGRVAALLALVYVLGAALRLARYNVESNRVSEPGHVTKTFRGLPSPGAAGVIAGLALFAREFPFPWVPWLFAALPPVLGLLMISRFGFPHIVNRYLAGSRSPFAVVFLLLALVLAVEMPEVVLAAGFGLYALSGPAFAVARAIVGRPRWAADEEDDEEVVRPDADDAERT